MDIDKSIPKDVIEVIKKNCMKKHQLVDVRVKSTDGGLYQTLTLVGFNYAEAKKEVFKILGMRNDGIRMPSYWQKIEQIMKGPKFFIILQLGKSSEEYKKIEEEFLKTMYKSKILKIERVQNRHLWTVFQTEVNRLTEKSGGVKPDVRYLYHGTSSTAPTMIYQSEEGFNMSFSPGGMWGRANYFAVNSAYSNQYKSTLTDGSFQMFYARVIIGNTIKQQPKDDLVMPPLLPNSQIDRYDSIQGHTGASDVFMVYANKKAYPEYLITYK